MAINYAEKYSSVVDEAFALLSLTDRAVNKDYDFTGVRTVHVYSLPTAAMNDYTATGTNRYGTPGELQDTVQDLVLSRMRAFTFTIDKTNAMDTPEGVRDAGKALARQIREVVIPEIDIYRIATIVTGAGTDATPAAITSSNAYDKFLDGQNALIENKVPMPGRLSYVSPNFYKSIKLDPSFIKASDLAQATLINGQLGAVDGVPIIPVPTAYLPTNVEFVIAHPVATTSPIKLAEYKIHIDPPGIAGALVEGLVYYDAFVLNNKAKAIYSHSKA
ncbi:MAG: N4-gp56 family major capsid protein [Syntrophomonadaceae bacterium]|nr:N4-gp56 family major capsid protein [Syntrophomonadaceae bacterium]